MTPLVLVVDDDPSISAVLSDVLRDEGFLVETARNGHEAMRFIAARDPHVILLDMAMPLLDGGAFLLRYRGMPGAAARVVVISANAESLLVGASLGADASIGKPFDVGDLVAIVRRLAAIDPRASTTPTR